MKKLLFIALLSSASMVNAQQYSRAKIYANSSDLQKLAEMGVAVDHGTIKKETFIISDFSDQELQLAKDAGLTVEILIDDVQAYYVNQNKGQQAEEKNTTCSGTGTGGNDFTPAVPTNFNLGSMGGFYTYQEFLDEIDAMAAQYPNLISSRAPISNFQTIQGRSIYWLRISDNPNSDEAEPEVLYTAIHHAREPNSLSEVIFYMWYLLENYGTSEEIQYLVNNTEMYFVPMINPDGYIYNETTNPNGGGMWRKNRRLNSGGSYGVDLNRNYSYGWGTTGTTTTQQTNETYCGTGAFSEPETQAIKWFCENRDFVYAFNAHTYANDILHPIGTTTAEFAEDHDYFQAFTGHMVQYNGYSHIKSSDLYPASGDSDDYMYKMDTLIKPKIFAMTPEVSDTPGGFWPASNLITGICQDMVFPNLILAHLSRNYVVVEDTDPTTISSPTGNFNHSAYRLGIEAGPVNVTITPLQGIASVGNGTTYNLNLMQQSTGAITYTLNSNIQFGDVVQYILNTDNGLWIKHDTITKTYGSLPIQFSDDASNNANWTGNWGTTTSTFVSPSTSFTDSPTGNYANNANKTYTLNQTIDLTNATAAQVSFYAKWNIEADYDYAQFQVSTDNGTTWQGQCGLFTNLGTSANGSAQPNNEPIYDGAQTSWVFEEISLSDYLGQSIKMRFVFESDGGVNADGFYFDDFQVAFQNDQTGISESALNQGRVIPNPAKQSATVYLDQPISKGTLKVVGGNGQMIDQRSIEYASNQFTFDVQNWATGIYYIHLENANAIIQPIKLVVIK